MSSPVQGTSVPATAATMKWIGQSLYTIKNRVYYSSVQIDKQIFRLGSCAYVEAPANYDKPFLGRISALFQGEKFFVYWVLTGNRG